MRCRVCGKVYAVSSVAYPWCIKTRLSDGSTETMYGPTGHNGKRLDVVGGVGEFCNACLNENTTEPQETE